MIVQNYRQLAQSRSKKNALKIIEAGLQAAAPSIGLEAHLKKDAVLLDGRTISLADYSGVHIVAFGKSADAMAKTASSIIDIKSAIVVMPRGPRPAVVGKKFTVLPASHPTPDQSSVGAAKSVTKFLKRRKKSEFVLFLVSGGASSMLCLPDGIELADKVYVNDLLLKSGATIHEINCIRKHLSQIKGGRLTENLCCDAAALVMSDVVGDDPSTIASGATYCDATTFEDARDILARYHIAEKLPDAITTRIIDGIAGRIPETPKSPRITNQIIASNRDCLAAMTKKAGQLGYNTKSITVSGDIKDATQKIKKNIAHKGGECLIFGGETTVRVIGDGRGGRNQELVLRMLKNLQRHDEGIVISSVGTDGIDGNTGFAGALTGNFRIEQAVIDSYLRESNSSEFFARYGGLVRTGHTHTNLMDIGVILQ